MSRYSAILILLLIISSGIAAGQQAVPPAVINGVVFENNSRRKLPDVSISVSGSSIGTVTNSDGKFTLRIPPELAHGTVTAEQIGYISCELPVDSLLRAGNPVALRLVPASKGLAEVVVRSGNAEEIVAEALKRIPQNYSRNRNMFTAFYRETVKKGRRYTGVSEAIVDVIKSPYSRRNSHGERVRVAKGRKLVSQNSRDTISVKLTGGPTLPVFLDVVKNGDALFDDSFREYYSFRMESPVTLDDRLQFRISFEPKKEADYALCRGVLYIDQESLSFTRAEFEFDMSDKDKATDALLRRNPRGLHFKPQKVAFTVTYRVIDGVSYLNYIHAQSKFKCDWKRRLFSSSYTNDAEMVMIDRTDRPKEGISYKAAFGRNDIFDDKVSSYWDNGFWQDYNIIEPTESLEKAVGKLLKSNARAMALTWDE